VHCCPNPRDMVAYSVSVKPTVWGGVPRIWEKLKAALETNLQEEQSAAMEIGLRRARAKQEGDVPAELEAEWRKADELVFSNIRAMLGLEEAEWFAVGAAPTPPEVVLFFDAMGIEIAELWGLSETCAVATINPPGAVRIGTVGKPLPGVEVALAEDGEIKVRGPIVMTGYRNKPEQTAEAFDEEGWFLTGDVGEIDADGYLRIVDRKKELIINAAGKNMSPANIEAKIKAADGIVAQAVAIGDRRPYNVALIALDPEVAAEDPEARVAAAVERANEQLSRVEQIKKFHIVDGEWEPGGDELTPTLKLKRKPIAEKYAEEIEALYS
jgi:long-chain acyl-CoA synthetase